MAIRALDWIATYSFMRLMRESPQHLTDEGEQTAMAKGIYHIRSAINRTFLDHEITLSGGGFDAKPSPIKQLLFYAVGALVILWSATSTFIGSANAGLITMFVIWALITVVYLGGLTKTKELRVMTVPAVLAFLPKKARHVSTRRNSDPSGLYSIIGIDKIDDDGGIHFADGTVGQAYLVVGSASYLLFDADRDAILDRVDAFWQKVQTTAEFLFITTSEPQRVYHQVASLERRNQALEYRDPDLLELQNEQFDILTQHVGSNYTSIHQYVLLKAKSPDALRQAHLLIQAEVESPAQMIKEAAMLDHAETISTLKVFYQGIRKDALSA